MRTHAALALLAAAAVSSGCQSSNSNGEGADSAPAATPAPAAQAESDPTRTVEGQGLPAGWQARFDRAGTQPTAVQVVAMDRGHRVTSGPAAVYWNPSQQATGNFTISATVHQLKQSQHPEAYGLVFGGQNLSADNQSYYYFLVRQDGMFTVKHRAGGDVHTLTDWKADQAVKATDSAGKSTNNLSVTVAADSVRFSVNGRQVAAHAKSAMGATDGLYGYRVNHNLDVHVEPITLTRR